MNIKDTMTRNLQCEINRLNHDMNRGRLGKDAYSKANRRRSEILDKARRLKLPIRAV